MPFRTNDALKIECTADGWLVRVRVAPKASRARIGGVHDGALKIAVTAAPEKGKANAAMLAMLAEALGIAKSSLTLVAGATARAKTVRVPPAVAEHALRALATT